jgi:hypothetical protein
MHIAVESESPATLFSQHAVSQYDFVRGSTRGNVLLVEPSMVPRSDRELLLSAANYRVTAVSDIHDVIVLRFKRPVAVAVLSDMLGSLRLRVAAEAVRRQWPEAKILILGCGGPAVEDHLYDEAVSHRHEATALLGLLQMLAENRWTKSMSADHAAWQRIPPRPTESDPTKDPERDSAVTRGVRGAPSAALHRIRAAG